MSPLVPTNRAGCRTSALVAELVKAYVPSSTEPEASVVNAVPVAVMSVNVPGMLLTTVYLPHSACAQVTPAPANDATVFSDPKQAVASTTEQVPSLRQQAPVCGQVPQAALIPWNTPFWALQAGRSRTWQAPSPRQQAPVAGAPVTVKVYHSTSYAFCRVAAKGVVPAPSVTAKATLAAVVVLLLATALGKSISSPVRKQLFE